MKKGLLSLVLAGVLCTGTALAMKGGAKGGEGTCKCPWQGQMEYHKMSQEEWEKYHKGMPMPEEMKKETEKEGKKYHEKEMNEEMEKYHKYHGEMEKEMKKHHEEMKKEEGKHQQEMEEKWHKKWH
ncbi:MAG TPA: hypothetical protein ENJ96_06900 [Thermodesulfatator atlanticus]|uniref:Uncharacterized protein n=1 Tax=Thermodesulfatator atlanticus TaxID=501497 RepID=A0A7V5P0X1_9BACT|nr:hypothetical protein [Thermodesulfatator atlanticus]